MSSSCGGCLLPEPIPGNIQRDIYGACPRDVTGIDESRGTTEPKAHTLARSRGGFGGKIQAVAEGVRAPLAVHATAGRIKECAELETVVNWVRIGRRRGTD